MIERQSKKIVKLVSGGLDSFIMSQEYEGLNVYVDFGQSYAEYELKALETLGVDCEVVKIDAKFKEDKIYIPNRNLTLTSIVSTLYNPDEIMLAGLKDDNCIDKNETEFEIMSWILSRYAGKTVKVLSPYWKKTKGEIVSTFKYKEKLLGTFSCYKPEEGQPCGNCPACLRRTIALESNGIRSNVPLKDEIIREYLKKIHTYDKDRQSRFFIYLNRNGGVKAVDIDGVICEEGGIYEQRKLVRKPTYGKYKYLVLYTARLESDREITEKWLKENNIVYDSLITNKLPYDMLVDDHAKPEE